MISALTIGAIQSPSYQALVSANSNVTAKDMTSSYPHLDTTHTIYYRGHWLRVCSNLRKLNLKPDRPDNLVLDNPQQALCGVRCLRGPEDKVGDYRHYLPHISLIGLSSASLHATMIFSRNSYSRRNATTKKMQNTGCIFLWQIRKYHPSDHFRTF